MKLRSIEQILQTINPSVDYTPSSDFIEDGLLDSLDIIRLVSELETNYAISIDGAEIVSINFVNLDAIAKLVKRSGLMPNEP
jgi:acyl carrier protein